MIAHDPNPHARNVERIGAIFGTTERVAAAFSAAVVIAPTKLHG